MYLRVLNLLNQLRASYWLVPSLMCVAAFCLALAAQYLDSFYAGPGGNIWPAWLIFQGDLEGARIILSTIAGSMITVAGVTFSITVVVLSMASSQYGPRLLLNFMRDTGNQVVLGTFVSTFLYCLLALGNGGGEQGVIPAASVSIGIVLATASVWVLIYFMHHVSSTVRAEHVVDMVARDVTHAIKQLVARSEANLTKAEQQMIEHNGSAYLAVESPVSGYLQAINEDGLLSLANEWECVIELRFRPGHFVNLNDPLILVESERHRDILLERLKEFVIIGRSRTDEEDPEYGINQLVEVAVRALSPGINDPITAMSCVDWLASALAIAADKPLQQANRFNEKAELRLVSNPVTYCGLVNSAFDQIRQNAYVVPAVSIRLMEALTVLAERVQDEQRAGVLFGQASALLEGCRVAQIQGCDWEVLQSRYQQLNKALGKIKH